MRFRDVENIWDVELDQLSKRDIGKIYVQRAAQVIAKTLKDPELRGQAVYKNRFRRDYLVKEIGCRSAATVQNPALRALLSKTDAKLAPRIGTTTRPKASSKTVSKQEPEQVIRSLELRIKVLETELDTLKEKSSSGSSALQASTSTDESQTDGV